MMTEEAMKNKNFRAKERRRTRPIDQSRGRKILFAYFIFDIALLFTYICVFTL